MAFYAKTYYSKNGWTGPQNYSDFGQPIAPGFTLGYEEFNFAEVIKEMKMLYLKSQLGFSRVFLRYATVKIPYLNRFRLKSKVIRKFRGNLYFFVK